MSDIVLVVLNALTLISILALVAIGLAIVFGMMDVINLAHGEFITLGAYTLALAQTCASYFPDGSSFWVGLVAAPVVGGCAGLLIEWAIISRLYQRLLDTVLATFGISLIIQKLIELAFGTLPQVIQPPFAGSVHLFEVPYPAYRLFVIAVSAVLIGATVAAFRYTNFGVDLRAVLQNKVMAQSLGIDAKMVTRKAFAFGAALAAIAGALVAPLASVEAHLGIFYLGKAFFVVILGGVGSIAGAIAGSVLVGGLETILNYQVPPSAASALVLVFAIVLVRIRPRGLVPGYSAGHSLMGKD